MKILIDSEDIPAETRLQMWRGMLCDTYMGMDCHFDRDSFRSSIKGHVVGDHTITRIRSTRHAVDRSRTLIKRDSLEMAYFAIPLAGRAVIEQAGREAVMERGTVVVSDSSRPFRTHVDESADILWLSLPKELAVDRIRSLEDLVAVQIPLPNRVPPVALGVMTGLDQALDGQLQGHVGDSLVTGFVALLAATIISGDLCEARSFPWSSWRSN